MNPSSQSPESIIPLRFFHPTFGLRKLPFPVFISTTRQKTPLYEIAATIAMGTTVYDKLAKYSQAAKESVRATRS